MPFEMKEENTHLTVEQDLDDPLDEQTTCGLMLQVFIHHQLVNCISLNQLPDVSYFQNGLSYLP